MTVTILKVALAPFLVCVATLAARRWGAAIGGIVIALPLVAGPILLVITLEQGGDFGAGAARGALLGVVALCAFCVAFARAAPRARWPATLAVAWLAYAVVGAGVSQVDASTLAGLVVAMVAIIVARASIGAAPPAVLTIAVRPPWWDLPARATSTAVLVIAVTSAADLLGPAVSGVLTPFPIATSVLAVFTLAHDGPDATVATLRGFTNALPAFALFFAVFALAVG